MSTQALKVAIDILVLKENNVLLGLLSKDWLYEGQQVYGVPGRDLYFGETIGDCVKRNMKEELNCEITKSKVICVNANYAFGNHYIGIGVVVTIEEDIIMMKPEDWEKWEWFEFDKIPSNLFSPAKNLIECYLQKKICVSE